MSIYLNSFLVCVYDVPWVTGYMAYLKQEKKQDVRIERFDRYRYLRNCRAIYEQLYKQTLMSLQINM